MTQNGILKTKVFVSMTNPIVGSGSNHLADLGVFMVR